MLKMNKFSELQKYGTETTWGEKESDQDRGLTRDVEQSESSALAPARAERRCYYFVFRLDCPFSSFHFSHPTRLQNSGNRGVKLNSTFFWVTFQIPIVKN